MVGLLAVSLGDFVLLNSEVIGSADMDFALAVCCMISLCLRHAASMASDKELAHRIAVPLVGVLGISVNAGFAILGSATVAREAPFRTQAALMDIGVNALILACLASSLALPLWYGGVVLLTSIPADSYLIYCAAVASSPSANASVDSLDDAIALMLSAKAVELKYFASCFLALGVFGWLTLSNRALHASLQQIADLSHAKERYIAALSHDFGTPIAVLQMAIEQLPPDALDMEMSRGMHAAIALLFMIRKKAIQLNRLQAGQSLTPELSTVSLQGVFDELESLAKLMPKSDRTNVLFRAQPGLGSVRLDRSWAIMMLVNLLSNALRHTGSGLVEVSACVVPRCNDDGAADTASWLSLRVADTGEGVPPPLKPLLFTAYARASKSRGSTGLGLYHLRQLAMASGGRVEHTDNVPAGAVFVVLLPLYEVSRELTHPSREPAVHMRRTDAPPKGLSPPDMLPPGKRWAAIGGGIIVDDDPTLVHLTTALLGQLGLRNVATANDGEGAITQACRADARPRWMVMDVLMDGIDGIDATRRVRAWEAEHPHAGHVLIFGLSANGDDDGTRRECFEAGMDEVLTTPLSIALAEQLFRTYYSVLARPPSPAPTPAPAPALAPPPAPVPVPVITDELSHEPADAIVTPPVSFKSSQVKSTTVLTTGAPSPRASSSLTASVTLLAATETTALDGLEEGLVPPCRPGPTLSCHPTPPTMLPQCDETGEGESASAGSAARFDLKAMISDLGGEHLARQILKSWLQSVPRYRQAIQTAMSFYVTRHTEPDAKPDGTPAAACSSASMSARAVRKAAHTLKGSARVRHADEAVAATSLLEQLAESAERHDGLCDMAALEDAWKLVQRATTALEANVCEALDQERGAAR